MSAEQVDLAEPRRGLSGWLARLEDGAVIRTAFFLMLVTTLAVLGNDLKELVLAAPPVSPATPIAPVLPAVERPEIDPGSPVF